MSQTPLGWRIPAVLNAACLLAAAVVLATPGLSAPAVAEPNDEIHSNFGDNASTSMWVHWRGPDSTIDYGITSTYGSTASAVHSPITPVDVAGPFWRVQLTGLTPGRVYHYRIGAAGLDHIFKTAPTRDFVWTDIGDTGTTFHDPSAAAECDKPWMAEVWAQVTASNPDFVTHGGDISYANDCGIGNVHRFFEDIAPIATRRALQFAWGNHEYGVADTSAPPGTPRDSLANYKGRNYVANPQLLPNDTASQTSHPGCPPPAGGTGNGCRGYDWGYFKVGHALFITYPEPEPDAYPDWQAKADLLMAAAQNNPNTSFIVTIGHRPAYSSAVSQVAPKLQAAVNALGDKYSPAARADGKYLLNIGHHVHGGEVIAPQHGVLQVTNGGGGAENFGYSNTDPNSWWKTGHFEHLRVKVTGATMKLDFICGPVSTHSPNRDPCTKDALLYSTTLTSPVPPPPVRTEYVLNRSVENGDMTGWLGVYNAKSEVTAVQPVGGSAHGTWALRVKNTATVAQEAGVQNARPRWVTNTTAATTYTGSAWVRGPPGTVVTLLLRECPQAGACSAYKAKSVTLGSGWRQVVTTLTAAAHGNQVRYSVYANSIAPGGTFLADLFSESAP